MAESTRPPLRLVPGIAAARDPERSLAQLIEWGRSGKRRAPSQFQLLRAFLGRARRDVGFRFFLDHPAHLKPFWDAQPDERERLSELRDQGRLGFACGLYRPIDSTAASLELMIRTAALGILYLEDYFGLEQHTFWHETSGDFDANLLSVLAACGIEAGLLSRIGDSETPEPGLGPTSARWLTPDGTELKGWRAGQLARPYLQLQRQRQAARRARLLRPAPEELNGTPILGLLPLVAPWAPPLPKLEGMVELLESEEAGSVHVCLPDVLRAEDPGAMLSSCIAGATAPSEEGHLPDGGAAHRTAGDALQRAETLSTWASLIGEPHPAIELDHGWRVLMASARREVLAGRINDQERLDRLAAWRRVSGTADAIAARAAKALARQVDTRLPRAAGKSGLPLVVFNALSWSHRTVAELAIPVSWLPAEGLAIVTSEGESLPFEVVPTDALRCRLRFLTPDLPPMGHVCVFLVPGDQRPELSMEESLAQDVTVKTSRHQLVMAPTWGGGIKSLRDRSTGEELLHDRQPGNELVVYPIGSHRRDGPGSRGYPARVTVRHSPLGTTIVSIGAFEQGWRRQEIRLVDGLSRIDFRTELQGFARPDRLVTVEMPFVAQGRTPVVGRALGAEGHPAPVPPSGQPLSWLTVEPQRWAGWSTPLRVRLGEGTRTRDRIVSRIEIVVAAGSAALGEGLLRALRPYGVTARIVIGALLKKSDADLRIVFGAPKTLPFVDTLLERAHPALPPKLRERRSAAAWLDLPGERPVLLLWANGQPLEQLVTKQLRRLESDGCLEADVVDPNVDRSSPSTTSVALSNRGQSPYRFGSDGTIGLTLCHLSAEGAVGRWPEPPHRVGPRGEPLGLGNETRILEYSLHTGQGDWREAGFVRAALEAQHEPLVVPTKPEAGPMPRSMAYLELESDSAMVSAVKRPGFASVDRLLARPLRRRPEVLVRVVEAHGRAHEARLKAPASIDSADWVDPTERLSLEPVTGKRQLRFEVAPYEIATLRLKLGSGLIEGKRTGGAAEPVSDAEATTWWRTGPGAEPERFAPLGVFVRPAVRSLDGPDPGEIEVRVVSNVASGDQSGHLELTVPPGWKLRGVPRKEVALGALASRSWRLQYEPAREDGLHLLRARWKPTGDGPTVESFARILIGPAPADEAPVRWRWLEDRLELSPGQHGTAIAELENTSPLELTVRTELIAPFAAWEHVHCADESLTLAPGESRAVTLDVSLPETMITGHVWVVAKVTAADEALYSEPLIVSVTPPA